MKESIVTNLEDRRCYICGYQGDLALHHMLHGTNRKKADEDGLTCWLCVPCHTRLHDQGYKDRDLQMVAQMCWQKHYGLGIPGFIARYGKSYL